MRSEFANVVILATTDGTTWMWLAAEVLAIGVFAWSATLWRAAKARDTMPTQILTRYKTATLGSASWAVLIAVRLIFHAY